ncbi:MAG: tetratricopeptide repeat protein [Candidatus Solibacter usitatus]|nr:tetratricopeptide repeat protein [Candidatus Solibacter usitatus]
MPRLTFAMLAGMMIAGTLCAQPESLALESRRGKELMAAGRFADAVRVYEGLVAAMPANPGLRLNLAMALHMSGQDLKAIPQFEAVLKQQPNALPALMLLGASHMRTGNPAKAIPMLEKAIGLAPEDLQGRAMLADALLMTDRAERAVPHLRKLAAAQPGNPRAWYALGKACETVAQRAFELLQKQGPDSPWWLSLAADARLSEGRNSAALALYRAALAKQPALRGAHARLAEIYRKTGHPDWAAQEEAAERKIGQPACATPTSECQFVKGRNELALSSALARSTPESLYWRSRAANEMAREAFVRLAKLPPSVESHEVMAELHRNQGRHAESIAEWKAALELAPGDQRLEQELLMSVYMSRDYAASEKLARALVAKDASVAELHFILGDSLMNQQQPEAAMKELREAIRLKGGYLDARAVLGRALMQIGQPEQALPHLKAALPVDTDGSLHFQLSRAYLGTGRPDLAAEALKTYQKLRQVAAPEPSVIEPPGR